MKKTQSQISYDQVAPFYRKISKERDEYLSSVDRIIFPFIYHKDSLVDLGSADGVRISNLANKARVGGITLVDNSPEMIKRIKPANGTQVITSSIVTFEPKTKYQVATCLWNVLGHVESIDDIKKTIINLDQNILKQDGIFILDVNNRYNVLSYGLKQVIINIIIDIFNIDKNEYVEFDKMIEGVKVRMKVHFFSPLEIEEYIKDTGLKIIKKMYVNYNSGKIEHFFWKGQALYILKKI